MGEMSSEESMQWKTGIFEVMVLRGMEPEDLIAPLVMSNAALGA